MSTTTHMYRENRKSLNWFVGCGHDCVYCKPSFQAQMKRQLHNCKRCYAYEPHAHLERLLKPPPKTEGDEFIFFPSSGDPAFATVTEFLLAVNYMKDYVDTMFLTQTKDPKCLLNYDFPPNVLLATTAETDIGWWKNTPSEYKFYSAISKAPHPTERMKIMAIVEERFPQNPIVLTVEPILEFSSSFIQSIKDVCPNIVYVGYDNHHCKLPEPTLEKTQRLIQQLEQFTEVRVKSLRKAWYEK